MQGRVGIIYIGGETEVVRNENRDKFVDSLNACKAALESGVVPGGGTGLLHASQGLLADLNLNNADQQYGVAIMHAASQIPFKLILRNAGLNYKKLAHDVETISDPWIGYNVHSSESPWRM